MWLAILALLAPLARAQGGAAEALGEGPPQNDVVLPVARDAELLLARGDEAYALLLAAPQRDAEAARRDWLVAFESWHDALGASATGDGVGPRTWRGSPEGDSPWPDPDGLAGGGSAARPVRRTEGVEVGVLRRLEALSPAQRRPWSERFGPLAEEALLRAGSRRAALLELERLHPATAGAARAALLLAELELESGRSLTAGVWLRRAERHTRLGGARELSDAIDRRRELALELGGRRAGAEPEPWRSARELEFTAEIPLENLSKREYLFRPLPHGPLRTGLCWTAAGEAVLQSEARVVVIDPRRARRTAAFDPIALLAEAGLELESPGVPRDGATWHSVPAADGELIVVALRTSPSALACFRLGQPELFEGVRPASVEWAIAGDVLHRRTADGLRPAASSVLPLGTFQPGPLIVEGRVLVQVHASQEGETTLRAHLAALELAGGATLWSRFLARGTARPSNEVRFARARTTRADAQPLARVGERVAVVTHLGAAALVEAADGRLDWSFAHRRHEYDVEGWTTEVPPVFDGLQPGLVLAPADSDRLYWLRGEALLEGDGLLRHAPRRKGSGLVLAAADADGALVLARSGRERSLVEWDAASGASLEAPWLAPGENFTGAAVASRQRVLFASDQAVYLHDRTRGLYLLDHAPYPTTSGLSGGSLAARGEHVLVVGPHLVWVLTAR